MIVALTNLREKGVFPTSTHEAPSPILENLHQIISSLLKKNPQERPSALELSNSSLLPPRLQADSSYFKEFTSALVAQSLIHTITSTDVLIRLMGDIIEAAYSMK